jgi:cytoskeletal protein CcmA (bactofilin family)
MFAKNERSPDSPQGSQPAAVKAGDKPSVISSDLEIVGDLKSAGDIQIDGRVKGDIRSRTVMVSVGAEIEGSIFADNVQISGTVKGQVEATKVSILKNSKVLGDILHDVLEVESGAHFQGACRRLEPGSSRGDTGSKSARVT